MDQFTCPTCRDMYDLAIKLIDWASGKCVDWDFVCYFCGARMPNPHRPGCLHVLVVEYMEKHDDRRDSEPTTTEDIAVAG